MVGIIADAGTQSDFITITVSLGLSLIISAIVIGLVYLRYRRRGKLLLWIVIIL